MTNIFESLIWTPSVEEIQKERLFIELECERLGLPVLEDLAIKAAGARQLSYSPYSGYRVGAAILSTSDEIEIGTNIEVATYSETGHAEEEAAKRLVMANEISRSGRRFIRAVAVSHAGDTAPCGRCRQVIFEFSDNALVIVADQDGVIRRITSMGILLPYAFKPSDLGKD